MIGIPRFVPSVTCHNPAPDRASTPRTIFAMDGSTMTSCVEPFGSFTCGKMSGCASMPRASPRTGIIVKRTIPFVPTDACVSCVSCEFHPLLALSADRVSQGAIF